MPCLPLRLAIALCFLSRSASTKSLSESGSSPVCKDVDGNGGRLSSHLNSFHLVSPAAFLGKCFHTICDPRRGCFLQSVCWCRVCTSTYVCLFVCLSTVSLFHFRIYDSLLLMLLFESS